MILYYKVGLSDKHILTVPFCSQTESPSAGLSSGGSCLAIQVSLVLYTVAEQVLHASDARTLLWEAVATCVAAVNVVEPRLRYLSTVAVHGDHAIGALAASHRTASTAVACVAGPFGGDLGGRLTRLMSGT